MNNSFVILWLSCDILSLINHKQLPEAFQLHLIFFISQTNKRFLHFSGISRAVDHFTPHRRRLKRVISVRVSNCPHSSRTNLLPMYRQDIQFVGNYSAAVTRVTLVDLQVAWLLAKWIKSSLEALCTLSEACVFACKITKQMIERKIIYNFRKNYNEEVVNSDWNTINSSY